MNEILKQDLPEHLRPFEQMIAKSIHMKKALESVSTVTQLILLNPLSDQDRPLCIVNTHLISHSNGEHIRLVHVIAMLHEAKRWIEEKNVDAQIIFMGDLNSSIEHKTGLVDGTIQSKRLSKS